MDNKVKSGKEILDSFFEEITVIENVDKLLAKTLQDLYQQGRLSEANVKNELQQLRDSHEEQN